MPIISLTMTNHEEMEGSLKAAFEGAVRAKDEAERHVITQKGLEAQRADLQSELAVMLRASAVHAAEMLRKNGVEPQLDINQLRLWILFAKRRNSYGSRVIGLGMQSQDEPTIYERDSYTHYEGVALDYEGQLQEFKASKNNGLRSFNSTRTPAEEPWEAVRSLGVTVLKSSTIRVAADEILVPASQIDPTLDISAQPIWELRLQQLEDLIHQAVINS